MVRETLTARLKQGEILSIKVLEPPLDEYAAQVGCWGNIKDDLLGGRLSSWLYTPYFVGEIDGNTVGSMSYYTPTDTKDVGVVEFVRTDEAHRQKGIASALMSALVQRFRAQQGTALYLCTTNPIAGKLYETHGFWYHIGDGMRLVVGSAQEFDRTYFAYEKGARIRAAHWGDLPRAAVLYNHPQPEWLIKEYFSQCFRETRFESHFVGLLRRCENNQGVALALEAPSERLVGFGVIIRAPTYCEQHTGSLSFRIHPTYRSHAPELLEALIRHAQELGITCVSSHVAECDQDQQQLLAHLSFVQEARLKQRLRDGDRWWDMFVYTKITAGTPRPMRDASTYYGSRQPWQTHRTESR